MLMSEFFENVNKTAKEDIASIGIKHIVIKRIPFSSPRLNYITYGGIPRGRITMFAGKESSGKTTTALDVIRNAQRIFNEEYNAKVNELTRLISEYSEKSKSPKVNDYKRELAELQRVGAKKAIIFDAESTIEANWSSRINFDIEQIGYVRLGGYTAEQFLDIVVNAIRQVEGVGLIVIDSVAALVSQQTLEESLTQKSMGGNAKVVTDFISKVQPLVNHKDITCIIINQARDDFKNPYADFAIPCGNGLKHASSMILTFQKGKYIDASGIEKSNIEEPVAVRINVRVQKTKVCKPDRRVGYYTLNFDKGIDVVADIINVAINYGMINKNGSWYTLANGQGGYVTDESGNVLKFQGSANLQEFLSEHPAYIENMLTFINRQIELEGISPGLQISAEEDIESIRQANLGETIIGDALNEE